MSKGERLFHELIIEPLNTQMKIGLQPATHALIHPRAFSQIYEEMRRRSGYVSSMGPHGGEEKFTIAGPGGPVEVIANPSIGEHESFHLNKDTGERFMQVFTDFGARRAPVLGTRFQHIHDVLLDGRAIPKRAWRASGGSSGLSIQIDPYEIRPSNPTVYVIGDERMHVPGRGMDPREEREKWERKYRGVMDEPMFIDDTAKPAPEPITFIDDLKKL